MSPASAGAHSRPVGLLAAILAVLLTVGWFYHYAAGANALAGRYVRALGPQNLPFKAQTLTLQRAALRQSDILPIYGTSELYCCGQPDNAGTFFNNAPTGFAVFNVGYPVTEDLFWAETFGALGHELRGKKLVVSDSPWFTAPQGIAPQAYAHTFSPEIAAVFTFDAPVPLALRAAVARRMLAFPTTLTHEPLVRVALQDLARGGWRGDLAYALLDPIGRLAAWSAQLQDAGRTIATIDQLAHPRPAVTAAEIRRAANLGLAASRPAWWRTLLHIPSPKPATPLWILLNRAGQPAPKPLNPYVPNRPSAIQWNQQLQRADLAAAKLSTNNPFGVADTQWKKCTDITPVNPPWCARALTLYKAGKDNHDGQIYPVPPGFVHGVEVCTCWTDLDLEFEVLRSVQAQPLAWVQPLQGFLADHTPYSAAARRVLYDRYMAIADAEGIPATTFQTHDTDPMFINSFGHLSPRGWLYADRLLDLYWHGQLDTVRASLEAGGSVDALFPPDLNCPKAQWCRGVTDVPPIRGELNNLPVGLALPVAKPGG